MSGILGMCSQWGVCFGDGCFSLRRSQWPSVCFYGEGLVYGLIAQRCATEMDGFHDSLQRLSQWREQGFQ